MSANGPRGSRLLLHDGRDDRAIGIHAGHALQRIGGKTYIYIYIEREREIDR